MNWRLEVTPEGLHQLIAKKTIQRGFLDLRIEQLPDSDEQLRHCEFNRKRSFQKSRL